MKTLRQRYPSSYTSVPKARRDVASFARQCGLNNGDVYDLSLAAGEAFNNAAEHAHVANGSFALRCSYANDELVIEVTDQGQGFDLTDKGKAGDPAHLRLRGLGIFIMRSLMDDVCFTVHPSGTSVRLTKRIRRNASGDSPPFPLEGDGSLRLHSAGEGLKALMERRRVHPNSRGQRL